MSESIQRLGPESRVNLHHDAEPRAESRSRKHRHNFFTTFVRTECDYDEDRFNVVQLFRVISEDSAKGDSLNESPAFFIEGVHCRSLSLTKKA